MRPRRAVWVPILAITLAMVAPRAGRCSDAEERLEHQSVAPSTWVDHDGRPVPKPKDREPGHLGHLTRESLIEPINRAFDIPDKLLWLTEPLGVRKVPGAANVNDFDEVPNSTWFTNRNHVRSLSPREVFVGPQGDFRPTAPYTIKSVKKHGFNPGFNVKDGAGRRWVVKLDAPGYPQTGSGAGVVASRLIWAAGYNVSHDESFRFRRDELKLDEDLVKGKDGEKPFGEADLNRLLERGARADDGSYYASASLFLSGSPVGPLSFRGKRKDDPNDRIWHKNRRELRGLYVAYSWLNNWDVKDHQSLDTYGPDSATGYVTHYLLDMNGSLGAAAEGAKPLFYGYEQRIDPAWILRRFVTLGFVVEPWRKARQKTGIPSVGNLEAEYFHPGDWAPLQYVESFRRITLPDAYWGAKLVASFTDDQITAAVDAAHYEDPRARAFIRDILIRRRDKVASYWFDRVAPLDFFHVEEGVLRFHDLAVDLGLTRERAYRIHAERDGGRDQSLEASSANPQIRLPADAPEGSRASFRFSIVGSRAKPADVDLERHGGGWVVTRVRHG